MEALVAVVADCIEAHSPMDPLGFRYREEKEFGELIVYPTPVEIRGGAVVWLRVLSDPSDDEESGLQLDTSGQN